MGALAPRGRVADTREKRSRKHTHTARDDDGQEHTGPRQPRASSAEKPERNDNDVCVGNATPHGDRQLKTLNTGLATKVLAERETGQVCLARDKRRRELRCCGRWSLDAALG